MYRMYTIITRFIWDLVRHIPSGSFITALKQGPIFWYLPVIMSEIIQ